MVRLDLTFKDGVIEGGDEEFFASLPEANYILKVVREPTPRGERHTRYHGGPVARHQVKPEIEKYAEKYGEGTIRVESWPRPALPARVLSKFFGR